MLCTLVSAKSCQTQHSEPAFLLCAFCRCSWIAAAAAIANAPGDLIICACACTCNMPPEANFPHVKSLVTKLNTSCCCCCAVATQFQSEPVAQHCSTFLLLLLLPLFTQPPAYELEDTVSSRGMLPTTQSSESPEDILLPPPLPLPLLHHADGTETWYAIACHMWHHSPLQQ